KFQSCKAVIAFSPWNGVDNQLIIQHLSCRRTRPSLPKNPQFLGYRLPHNANELFVAFQSKHRRFYSRQVGKRLNIFKKNLLKIQLLQDLDNSAKYGITSFADVDVDEFRRTHTTMKRSNELMNGTKRIFLKDVFEIPTSFDWRTKGAVTEVKDQGWCGSCWAFGTVGNIETKWFLKTGALVSLSEQQLLDCDQKDEACNGGLPEWAFPQIIQMGGLMSEKDYPYEAHKENSCHLVKNNVSAKIDDWAQLPKDEKKLAAWLVENGTITVGINANFLQFYMSGISHPPHFLCSDEGLDHAVLLVGYGVSSFLRRPYWIVKNSWGSGWGESGYFRLYRGDGTCGINADATTSVIY
ncbi:Viral cathepsin, partial [Fasciolopsis buskii]